MSGVLRVEGTGPRAERELCPTQPRAAILKIDPGDPHFENDGFPHFSVGVMVLKKMKKKFLRPNANSEHHSRRGRTTQKNRKREERNRRRLRKVGPLKRKI